MNNIQQDFEKAGFRIASLQATLFGEAKKYDLIMCLSAINDPSDSLATVSALRSSIYGCGDDDLYLFKINNPKAWDWVSVTAKEQLHAQKTTGRSGLGSLAELHANRTTMTPSELMGQIIQDRQIEEQCATRRIHESLSGESGMHLIKLEHGPTAITDCYKISFVGRSTNNGERSIG